MLSMKNNRQGTTTPPLPRGRMLAASCLAFASLGAHAAGHFDVDDAGTLDPGQCQYETWWGRAGAEPAAWGRWNWA
jgi:hypothetical protein